MKNTGDIMLEENEKIFIPFKILPIHFFPKYLKKMGEIALWRENVKLLILRRMSE